VTRAATTGRYQSRRVALQVLYALDLAAAARAELAPPSQEVFERVAANFDLQAGARAFAEELVAAVAAHREAIDARIAANARNWRLERMAAVDRNVLRLATCELAYTDTPDSVVIDQAIELARDFGTEHSPAFVNGVLDAISRDLHGAPAATPASDAPPEGAR